MTSTLVRDWENKLDAEFNNNPLGQICYSQAIWSILSVMEDKYLKFVQIDQLSKEQLSVNVDAYLNALTHPLRTLYKQNKHRPEKIKKDVIDEHYGWAWDWLDKSIIYCQFCSIYSLWSKNKISLNVESTHLDASGWRNFNIEYEAYNRLFRKDLVSPSLIDPSPILEKLKANISVNKHRFKLNLNPKLVRNLISFFSSTIEERYNLPSNWSFKNFTFEEFKKVFTTIQAILFGCFVVRSILAMNGLEGCGYPDAVWVVGMYELKTRLSRYTKIDSETVHMILRYITFGEVGIRNPDIALQPIIDLKNGFYALSPFVFLNTNVERNLCTLLNYIESEKKIYSKLTKQKENILRDKLIPEIEKLGYQTSKGKLYDTDVDLAIIDRDNKICISFELKWFIEPAEILEIVHRTEDLQKGVSQAKNILGKFTEGDTQLIKDVLNIDHSYSFSVAVGSMNWIGHFDVQSPKVPIIKINHFMEELEKRGSLRSTVDWLNDRMYLPKKSVDFDVEDYPLEIGPLRSSWYGIRMKDP